MNILIDFITASSKTGAAEYLRRVLFEILDRTCRRTDIHFFGLYDSGMGIAYEDLAESHLIQLCNINYIDCKQTPIDVIVRQYRIDRFFIACAPYFAGRQEIENIKCKVICVTHDLCYEELYFNKIYLYFDLISSEKEAYKSPLFNIAKYGIDFMGKLSGRNMVLDNFAWDYIRGGGRERYKERLAIMKPVYSLYRRNENMVMVTVSEYSKWSLVYNFGIKPTDIKVLYSPERVLSQGKGIENKELAALVESRKKYFLMVSANRTAKNPYKVVNVFREYAKMNKDLYLVTVGYERKMFENHILLPFLSDNDLTTIYSNCYALIYPSFFEGFGYPPLEAMKYAKPVLCSNTTSLPEIFGDAPIYFSPFYETAIFAALCQLNDANYKTFQKKSEKRYELIAERQNKDLDKLIDLLIN